MDKTSFLPLSGFRDNTSPVRDEVMAVIRQIFQSYGYQPLETPALERQEILLGKMGEEAQKQLYLFEDNGGRQVGLRYDLTVPLSRFVASNLGHLALPYKRYEIGSSWRAEKAQKGRYRQFTQADVDVVGAPEPSTELELLSIAAVVCERLKIKAVLQINDRRLVASLLDYLKVSSDKRVKLLQLLDKKDKLPEDEFTSQFKALGLSDVEERQIRAYFLTSGDEALELAEKALGEVSSLETVKAMLAWAKKRKFAAEFTPAMVRGLDYYTGAIFELVAADFPRSLAAGGRYDSLVEGLTGQKIPAIGLSFGVDNIADYLEETMTLESPLFMVRLPETSGELNLWVRQLRENGLKVDVYLDETAPLGKQIKYADKRGYQTILIPFEDEWKKGQIVRKDLKTGQQTDLERDKLS